MGVVADVRTFLVEEGIVDGATDWLSAPRRIHDGSDQLVVLTEDGGMRPMVPAPTGTMGGGALKIPAIHITVRAKPWDGDSSMAKAQEIYDALVGKAGTIGSTHYLVVSAQTADPIFVGFDDKGRPRHTIAFNMMTSVR